MQGNRQLFLKPTVHGGCAPTDYVGDDMTAWSSSFDGKLRLHVACDIALLPDKMTRSSKNLADAAIYMRSALTGQRLRVGCPKAIAQILVTAPPDRGQ